MTSRAYGARSSYSHYDVILIMSSCAYGARNPRSQYDVLRHRDVIHYWAGHAHRYRRTYVTDTSPCLVYHHTTPRPFYSPFSGTTRVSRWTSGLYGARED